MQELGEHEKHQEAAMLNYDCTYRTILLLLLNYSTTTIYYKEEEGRGVGTCIRNDERRK